MHTHNLCRLHGCIANSTLFATSSASLGGGRRPLLTCVLFCFFRSFCRDLDQALIPSMAEGLLVYRACKASRIHGQLWAFYRRILEDRPVRLAEFFRVSRTGFRVMSMIGQPFGKLYRLKRRWLRPWLVSTPWYWWFSAARAYSLRGHRCLAFTTVE